MVGLLIKMLTRILVLLEIEGKNLHVYQKINSIVTETPQASFTSADLTLTHVGLLAGRALKSWNDAYVQYLNVV